MEIKRECNKCRENYPIEHYGRQRRGRGGRGSICRTCRSEYQRERKSKLRNRTKVKPPKEKLCSQCKEVKPSTSFSVDLGEVSGLHSYCIECKQNYDKITKKKYRLKLRERETIVIPKEKYCSTCGVTKHFNLFSKNKNFKDGLNCQCKECVNFYNKNNNFKNKNLKCKVAPKNRICYKCKQNKLIYEFRQDGTNKCGYSYSCKTCDSIQSKKYLEKLRNRSWSKINLPKTNKCNKCLQEKSIGKFTLSLSYLSGYSSTCVSCNTEIGREFRNKNRIQLNEAAKAKYHSDSLYKFIKLSRQRLYNALGANKNKNTNELVGDFKIAKEHIDKQLENIPEFNWDNHGEVWHVDHIIPLASGKTIEEIEKLCHYTNLQPLDKTENEYKNDLMPDEWRIYKKILVEQGTL